MRPRQLAVLGMLGFSLSTPAIGQELTVADVAIATAVETREPVGRAESFSADVGQLVCWTRLTGGEAGTQIEHVWYRGDEEAARVSLDVGASTWRTWSRKTVLPEWTGQWRVDVVGPDGTVLKSLSFRITGD